MYALDGTRRIPEYELDWLAGYEGSTPVRVGNAAASQFQLDVWGEVLDGLHLARHAGLHTTDDAWELQRALLDFLEGALGRPGQQPVGGARAAPAVRALQGDGLGRASTAASRRSSGSASTARSTAGGSCARRSTTTSARKGYDADRDTFTQFYGSQGLDAALLLHPPRRVPPAGTTRASPAPSTPSSGSWTRTASCCATARTPTAGSTACAGREGAFLACTLLAGRRAHRPRPRRDEAEELFERLLDLRNDLGPAQRGVRRPRRPPGRQHPAGVQPRRPGQHRPPSERHPSARSAGPEATADAPPRRAAAACHRPMLTGSEIP